MIVTPSKRQLAALALVALLGTLPSASALPTPVWPDLPEPSAYADACDIATCAHVHTGWTGLYLLCQPGPGCFYVLLYTEANLRIDPGAGPSEHALHADALAGETLGLAGGTGATPRWQSASLDAPIPCGTGCGAPVVACAPAAGCVLLAP